jgi:hypothetical protein
VDQGSFQDGPADLYAFEAQEATTIQELQHGRVFDLAQARQAKDTDLLDDLTHRL